MSGAGCRDERVLFQRWRSRRDPAARDELAARYLPRARGVALRYCNRAEPLDDLEQVASIGLVKALDRYDPDQGAAFWTYALPTIVGELKRHFRDSCWTLRVPRSLQDRALAVQGAITRLSGELGRSPSPAEIAEALDLSSEQVLEAMEAGAAYATHSLDAHVDRQGDGARFADLLGADDEALELAERRAALRPALRQLPERERLILHLRFAEDLTQTEIARRVGVSQMHVSRLIRRALERLRGTVRRDGVARAA